MSNTQATNTTTTLETRWEPLGTTRYWTRLVRVLVDGEPVTEWTAICVDHPETRRNLEIEVAR